jgi:hypothetical protein
VLPNPSDDAIRSLAERILARPEYAHWRPNDTARQVFEWLVQLVLTNPPLFWTLVAAMLLVLLAIGVHLVWTIRVGLARRSSAPEPASDGATPRFLDEADALAARGRFLEAARALHLGALHLLVRGGRVELGRSDANTVLRHRLRAASLSDDDRGELLSLLQRLERAWFRDRNEDEGLYEGWRRLYARLDVELAA